MKILVTGGAGFIGTNFVYHMVTHGHDVRVLDKLTYAGGKDNLEPLGSKIELMIGDICDPDAAMSAVKDCDWVVHYAAESHNTRSEMDPDLFYRTNVDGTQTMLDAAVQANVKKFVHISCYDEKTRAFTRTGLKNHWDLTDRDEVLTLNPETSQAEWQQINKVIIQDYEGELVKIKNKRLNLLVTPNHRMLIETPKARKLKFITADTLLKRAVSRIPSGRPYDIPIDEKTQAWFYFMGFFIGDGFLAYQEKSVPSKTGLKRQEYLQRARNSLGQWESIGMVGTQTEVTMRSYRIFIDVPEKDIARKKIENTLNTLDYKWHKQKGRSGEHIYLTNKALYPPLLECGHGAKNKKIPPYLLEAPREALESLLDGLIDSDGRYRPNGKGGVITTASSELVNGIVELCAKLGYSSAVKKYHNVSNINGRKIEGDSYIVSIGITQRSIFRSAVSTEQYKGKIWCVSVPPNKNILVEREGKFMFCGNTDEVYGSIENGSFTEADKLPGDVQATSAYSKSKALADDLVMDYGKKGYPVIVTRTTNNFGPWQFPEKALPRWITNILTNKKIPIWGEGLQVRDWLFAPDNAKAHAFILEHGELGQAYNVAANQANEITNKQAATWVCELLNKNPAEWLDFIPDPRPDHDFRYALNTDKLAQLGWSAEPKAYQQFKETIDWYVAHPEWWQKRKAEAEKIYS